MDFREHAQELSDLLDKSEAENAKLKAELHDLRIVNTNCEWWQKCWQELQDQRNNLKKALSERDKRIGELESTLNH